jgi:ABC-2 type transport system permease protein
VIGSRALPARRSGPGFWWESYLVMLRWEITRMRTLLPITALVQVFTGAGAVLGFGLLIGDLEREQALFLSTGAVVITLVTIGIVLGPQLIAQQRLAGQFDYLASLPVPKSTTAAAWTTVNVIVAVPGATAALLVATIRYSVGFDISLLLLPAAGLTLVSGALIGYAYAVAIPHPRLVALVSQVLIFVIFGFSPIAFPPENLPEWLQAVHRWLPFEAMADVMRAGLTHGLVTDVTRSFVVLSLWTVIAAFVTGTMLRRRA